jgi:hypothetical protein
VSTTEVTLCAVARCVNQIPHDFPTQRLCWHCQDDLEYTLRSLTARKRDARGREMPSLLEEVRSTALGQGRRGTVNVGVISQSDDIKLPLGDQRAVDALRTLHNELSTWIRVLYEENMPDRTPVCLAIAKPDGMARVLVRGFRDLPDCEDSIESMAAWLARRMSWLADHEAADELYDSITSAIDRCWSAIDSRPARAFAGKCAKEDCLGEVYGKPGGTVAYCVVCRSPYDGLARRNLLFRAAEKLVLTPAEISRTMPMLLGRVLSPETIRTWRNNSELEPAGWTDRGHPKFLVGDVLALALTKASRDRSSKLELEPEPVAVA